MARISKTYLEARFKRVHAAMGWLPGPIWQDTASGKAARVGAVFLQKGPMGGWKITEIVNAGGAERDLTGWGVSLSASELDAWFSGILFAKEGVR